MPTNLKIDQFAPSGGVDGTAYFAGVQTVGGIVKDVIFDSNQLLSFIVSNYQQYPFRVAFANPSGLTVSTNPIGIPYTASVSSVYQVSSNLNITSGTGSVNIEVIFTDIHGTVFTKSVGSETGIGFSFNGTYTITVLGGTTITFKSILTGTATYDVSFALIRVS